MAIRLGKLGAGNEYVLYAQRSLACCLLALGENEAAYALMMEVMPAHRAMYAKEGCQGLASTVHIAGRANEALGKFQEALDLYEESFRYSTYNSGENAMAVGSDLLALARSFANLKNHEKALDYSRAALTVWFELLPQGHERIIEVVRLIKAMEAEVAAAGAKKKTKPAGAAAKREIEQTALKIVDDKTRRLAEMELLSEEGGGCGTGGGGKKKGKK